LKDDVDNVFFTTSISLLRTLQQPMVGEAGQYLRLSFFFESVAVFVPNVQGSH
jgi:hypothetical protein